MDTVFDNEDQEMEIMKNFHYWKEFDSVFDTDLLVEYDKLYYLELIYYTKEKELTNIDKTENILNAPNNFSFITNDIDTMYEHYEVFREDWNLLNNEFYSTTHLDTYVTYGRTQCKVASESPRVYKCRVTYQINPNVFHKSSDDPNKEVKGAQLVFRFDSLLPYNEQDDFVAISELGWHSEVAGTDDMIPEIENFPFQEFDPDGDKTILDYVADIFTTIINLPINIGKAILDILQTLFIPEDNYFETKFNIIRDLMDKKLGFLYYPISIIEDFVDYVLNIPTTQHALFEIPKMELMGYTLVPSMSIDLLDIVNSNDNFKNIYEIYRTFASGMIVLWLVQLAIQKEKEFMGGGR